MSKSGYTIFGISAALTIAALAGWFFSQRPNQLQPIEETVSINTGVTLFKQKKYAEAIEILENVQPGHPQEWYSLYYLGSAYIMLKNYQAAVEHLEMALRLSPTETQVMHALGVAYFKMGNLKMSKAYYAAILEIDPSDAEARGLMDIMANLERQQLGAEREQMSGENEEVSY